MKILTAAQTRAADAFTIQQENIKSVDLMERAANAFTCWFKNKFPVNTEPTVTIFCGPGNNGGDGLAIARLLHQSNYLAKVFIIKTGNSYSSDFTHNLNQLPQAVIKTFIENEQDCIIKPGTTLIIDALFGTGLNRPLTGLAAQVVKVINESSASVVAVDMPSGLFADVPNSSSDSIIQADFTVSFELPKLAFLLPGNVAYVGEWAVVPIRLNADFISETESKYVLITPDIPASILKPRPKYSHKGTYGHALLISGSYGKIGATVLCAQSCLRSGVGLLTVHCPAVGYGILQTAVPEAMTVTDPDANTITQLPDISHYHVIGIGPGLGKADATKQLVKQLLQESTAPLVLDADALNIISENEELKELLPPNSILTPHPKEFERLAGKAKNDYHRLDLLSNFCQRHQCYVILKGAHSCIGTPDGLYYFNTTGNPGMATGGTGDVLTGIITSLVAQRYSSLEACILGVYLHGLAGDLAKAEKGEQALIASDIIQFLGPAFLKCC